MSSIVDSNRESSPNEIRTTGAVRSRLFRENQKKLERYRIEEISKYTEVNNRKERELVKLRTSNRCLEEHLMFFNRINNSQYLSDIIDRNRLDNHKIKIKVSEEVQMLIRQYVLGESLVELGNLNINPQLQNVTPVVPDMNMAIQTLPHTEPMEPVEIRDMVVSLEETTNPDQSSYPQYMMTHQQASSLDSIEPSMIKSDVTPMVEVPIHFFDSLEFQDPTDSMCIMNQFSVPHQMNPQQQQHQPQFIVSGTYDNGGNTYNVPSYMAIPHPIFEPDIF